MNCLNYYVFRKGSSYVPRLNLIIIDALEAEPIGKWFCDFVRKFSSILDKPEEIETVLNVNHLQRTFYNLAEWFSAWNSHVLQ